MLVRSFSMECLCYGRMIVVVMCFVHSLLSLPFWPCSFVCLSSGVLSLLSEFSFAICSSTDMDFFTLLAISLILIVTVGVILYEIYKSQKIRYLTIRVANWPRNLFLKRQKSENATRIYEERQTIVRRIENQQKKRKEKEEEILKLLEEEQKQKEERDNKKKEMLKKTNTKKGKSKVKK